MFPLITILHPLVDACSVTVLVVGGMSWQRVLLYNALAFALQFPLGVALDSRPHPLAATRPRRVRDERGELWNRFVDGNLKRET